MSDVNTVQTTPSGDGTAVAISFSQEELAFIMENLGIQGMIGFSIPQSYNAVGRELARKSLLVRGFATEAADGVIQLDETVATLIVSSAAFMHAMNIKTTARDFVQVEDQWFYFNPGFIVHHNRPLPGIEAFRNVPTNGLVTLLLSSALNIELADESIPEGSAFSLPKQVLQSVAQLKQEQGNVNAAQYLKSKGAPEAFIRDVLNPVSASEVVSVSVDAANSTDNEVKFKTDGLALYRAEKGFWLLQDVINPQTDTVRITPMDGVAALRATAEFMAEKLKQA